MKEYELLELFYIMKTFGHKNILYTLWMVNRRKPLGWWMCLRLAHCFLLGLWVLLYTHMPQAQALGLAKTCRKPFWRLFLMDFWNASQHLTNDNTTAILQAGRQYFQARYPPDVGIFTLFLLYSLQVVFWISLLWYFSLDSGKLTVNPP